CASRPACPSGSCPMYSPVCCTLRSLYLFLSNATATTQIYTLSLHDALPIYYLEAGDRRSDALLFLLRAADVRKLHGRLEGERARSEEHTSELQSHLNLVCRLLLEKKKKSSTAKRCLCDSYTNSVGTLVRPTT